MRLRFRWAGVAAAMLLTLPAHADRDPAAAAALFREGRDAAKKGDLATACPRFAESFRLDPAVGTLLNLADCEEKTGRIASAWQKFGQAADMLPAGDGRAEMARKKVGELAPRVPKLTVRVAPGSPDDTRVTKDGVELGRASWGVALPVDPGAHVVVAVAPGRAEQRFPVTLAEGKSAELVVRPGEPTAAPPPATSSASAPPPPPKATASAAGGTTEAAAPSRTGAYVALGVGGVGLVVGAVTGLMLRSKNATVKEQCDAEKRCTQEGADAASAGRSLKWPNVAAWGIGFAGVGVGTWLLLRPDGKKVEVGGVVAPGRAGLRVGGSF